MRSGNPSLGKDTFLNEQKDGTAMTIQGAVTKTLILLILLIASGAYSWHAHATGTDVVPHMVIGLVGSFAFAVLTIFFKQLAPYTAPVYALLEGIFIGAISAIYENDFDGIVLQAVLLTVSILFVMLILYKTRVIKATENFKLGVASATLAVAVVYLVDIILRFFGMKVPFIHETGWLGIGISIVIMIIAALNLILDFDFIEEGVKYQAPKYMEWYAAFGLIVTLVWLYLEAIRLLAKIHSSKD